MSSSPSSRQMRGRSSILPVHNDERQRSTSRTGLPMPSTALRASRYASNTQPTYDFITGGAIGSTAVAASPAVINKTARRISVSNPTLRHSIAVSQSQNNSAIHGRSGIGASIDNEDLRAKIKTLQYDLDNIKQERELAKIQQERDIRDALANQEELFHAKRTEEEDQKVSIIKYETLNAQHREVQDKLANVQAAQEKVVRKLTEEKRGLDDELAEAQAALASMEREWKRDVQDAEAKKVTLERSAQTMKEQQTKQTANYNTLKAQLLTQTEENSKLESENLRLKSQPDDIETLAIVKRELTEQVAHLRQLEDTNREQSTQLKILRSKQKTVDVIEEEKRALMVRVNLLDDVRKELQEERLQRQRLEDEKSVWTSYFATELQSDQEFQHPEDMAKAIVQSRSEVATLTDRLGQVQADLSEKSAMLAIQQASNSENVAELTTLREKAKNSPVAPITTDTRSKRAIERQKALALKEVAFLREQLRTFDSEDTINLDSVDQATNPDAESTPTKQAKHILALEAQLDTHRAELAQLTNDLSELELLTQPQPSSPRKRARPSTDETSVDSKALRHPGTIARHHELQEALQTLRQTHQTLQTAHQTLQIEHRATRTQLASAKRAAKTRILSLRQNPTSDFENVKYSTIQILRQENTDLKSQLAQVSTSGSKSASAPSTRLVPASSLTALQTSLEELTHDLAERDKRMLRLKQIWAAKALEFREAVFSLLGWRMDFRPNGKFALSLLSHKDGAATATGAEGERSEDETLIFDGENGTMKVVGGMDSAFARDLVKPLTREWVEGKGYVPGLMASILLRKVDDGSLNV